MTTKTDYRADLGSGNVLWLRIDDPLTNEDITFILDYLKLISSKNNALDEIITTAIIKGKKQPVKIWYP